MKIATITQIAEALGCSRQNASKEYIKKGLIVKRDDGTIDIEDKQNRAFLKSRDADFSIFYPKEKKQTPKEKAKVKKTVQKSQKKPDKEKAEEKIVEVSVKSESVKQKPAKVKKGKVFTKEEAETASIEDLKGAANQHQAVDLATRYERLIGIKKDNELKELRIAEENKRLLDRKLVQSFVSDVLQKFSNRVNQTPESIVDNLISIILAQENGFREQAVQLMRNSLVDNIVDEFNKLFETRIKNME